MIESPPIAETIETRLLTSCPFAERPAMPAGSGRLRVEHLNGRNVVTRSEARSPLRLLSPRSPGRSAWVFTSTFGGGLVAGDQIDLAVEVGAGATCLLGTQSQTKVYRSTDGRAASQNLQACLKENATLVSMPDAVTCFDGSVFEQRQSYELSANSSLLWVEWLTSGRRARGERWAFRRYKSRTDVSIEGKLVFRDSSLLDQRDGPIGGAHRMGRCECFAAMLLIGPRFSSDARDWLAWAAAQPAAGCELVLFAASPVGNGVIVRVAGPSTEAVSRWLRERLSFLPGVLGGNPWERKW